MSDDGVAAAWSGRLRARLRRIVLVGTVVLGSAAVVAGLVGLATGGLDRGPVPSPSSAAALAPGSGAAAAPSPSPSPSGCSAGSAVRVARLVLTWDSGAGSRLDQVHRVLTAADPAGDEAPGLVRDLDGYLPSAAVWRQLAAYRTRQSATISRLAIPGSWPAIVRANRARLGSRLAAFTVHAVRHRSGLLDGVPESASSGVVFTMFVSCPAGSRWFRLIRLSRPGAPLP